jgi:hypothetical protein
LALTVTACQLQVKSVFHLHNAFKEISEFVDFDPITNYQWNKDKFGDTLAPKETSSKYGKDPKKVEQVLRTLAQKVRRTF